MDKENTNKLQTLTVGSQVFYPSHGVASVKGKEERKFGGGAQIFYVLELNRGGTLMLPLNNIERAGVRELISADKAQKLLDQAKADPEEKEFKLDLASRKNRAAAYAEALKSGSADRYTEVVQELLFRLRTDKLSASEQKTLEVARGYFVGEVAAALGQPPETVEADLLTATVL